MTELKGILEEIKHHEKLNIKVSNQDEKLNPEIKEKLSKIHKSEYFFFIFVIEGKILHSIEFNDFEICKNQMLFVLPNQLHQPKSKDENSKFYKVALDTNCLALLPKNFTFLINSFELQKVSFDNQRFERVTNLLNILHQVLKYNRNENFELILAYLNALFIEIEQSYIILEKAKIKNRNTKLYSDFKNIIENKFNQNITIESIAKELNISNYTLYSIVKKHSGKSPKEILTKRILLEAVRKLHFSDLSIKELSYELGFSDPNHFAKAFKKETGLTVSDFTKNLQDL